MQRKRWGVALMVALLCVSLVLPSNILGADNYTHNANISRNNTVVDSGYNDILYNNNPYYVQIPQWNGNRQYSNTTPAVVGSNLFQFTYDQKGKGYLTKIALKKPDATWEPGNGITLDATLIASFSVGTSGGRDAAAGISGPTIKDGYLAVAVGDLLYWWTIDADGNRTSNVFNSPIQGNPGNTTRLIASSPLVTPPLIASGTNMLTFEPVTWETPFAVVGSWSGGVISQPLYTLDGVTTTNFGYKTTDDASKATNDIVTSSPAWNSGTTVVGAPGAAVFGVAAYASGKNRLILMNPTTGSIKTVYDWSGSPIFGGPIDSSPSIAPNGHIYVPDHWGGIYRLNANGDYMAKDISAMDKSSSNISNIAVDGQNVIWVGDGHTTLNAAPISGFGSMRTRISSFSGLGSPAVVSNGTTDTVFLASDSTNGLLVTNPITISNPSATFGNEWRYTWQTLGSVSATYTSVAADIGTDPIDGSPLQFVTAWTNYGLNSQGCVEIWAPSDYNLKATANPNVVNSGEQVIIRGMPSPEGLTKSMKAHITDGGENTIDINLVQWSRSPERWQNVINAPNNYTGADAVYTVTVTATQTSGKTTTATTNFTVNPIPLPPPGNLTGTLRIEAWRRNNTMYPLGTAKYGNELAVTLTVDPPPPPQGLLNAQVTNAYITKAWVNTPRGKIGWDASGRVEIQRREEDINLILDGLVGTTKYKVDWAGYPPPIPDNTVMETNYIYAPFGVHVDYMYQVPVATEGGVVYIWQTGSYEASGNAGTTLDIIGTDLYIFNQEIHDAGTPVWQP
ncbi:hypothetical protein UF75_3798 [Desulfosporosinus sp. I2]|uniref:PQQ-binding-like beta-propeller repeat protein n=1 Tax=Desulfosporosinus sp. I2 TaxID=1617025 RepID=UPI0005EE8219|nr:PQQ-binding-like beta-propeller repeat protein [Desulfosporosinus sp. I2]KJR45813.1 hypothetical protein UF75_3798 [Desulfosporosinus sp. I2]